MPLGQFSATGNQKPYFPLFPFERTILRCGPHEFSGCPIIWATYQPQQWPSGELTLDYFPSFPVSLCLSLVLAARVITLPNMLLKYKSWPEALLREPSVRQPMMGLFSAYTIISEDASSWEAGCLAGTRARLLSGVMKEWREMPPLANVWLVSSPNKTPHCGCIICPHLPHFLATLTVTEKSQQCTIFVFPRFLTKAVHISRKEYRWKYTRVCMWMYLQTPLRVGWFENGFQFELMKLHF